MSQLPNHSLGLIQVIPDELVIFGSQMLTPVLLLSCIEFHNSRPNDLMSQFLTLSSEWWPVAHIQSRLAYLLFSLALLFSCMWNNVVISHFNVGEPPVARNNSVPCQEQHSFCLTPCRTGAESHKILFFPSCGIPGEIPVSPFLIPRTPKFPNKISV